MEELYLVTNPGSSSRKYGLYRGDEEVCNLHFEMEGNDVVCTIKKDGKKQKLDQKFKKLTDTVKYVRDILDDEGYISATSNLSGIVARVAAPGKYFSEDHIVDDDCLERLDAAKKRAPLHVPVAAAEIEACVKTFGDTPVIAVSDSSFHNTRDDVHKYYAFDKDLADRIDVYRTGYHGLSIGSIREYLKSANLEAEKVIVCHIGSGSSATALLNGESVDTTIGYSPNGGLMMATRCGDIDPAAALAIARELNLDNEGLEGYLNKECGLKGVGGTDDMREIICKRDQGDEKAALAYDMYIYRLQVIIGQLAAAMHGVDELIFTATVGERNSMIRRDVVAGLEYLGFKIDAAENDKGLTDERHVRISAADSKPIYVIATDETGEMLRRAKLLLEAKRS